MIYTMSSDEYYYHSSDTESDSYNEIKCTNMDPALAKIMGIFIEEQTQEKNDWTPPTHSGLSNSARIIKDESKNESKDEYKNEEKKDSTTECKIQEHDYIFENIKHKIQNFDKLLQNEIEHMKSFTNLQKLELIRVYNNIINNIIND